MTMLPESPAVGAAAKRKRVLAAERRTLVRRHDFALATAEAALARARAIVTELALLDAVDAELDAERGVA